MFQIKPEGGGGEGVDYIVLDGELLQLQEEGIKKDHLTQPS